MDQTTNYAIELDPDFANFYPAVPYPGTALYEKCVQEGLLRPEDADWSKMEYSYYLLRGNGLDAGVVMDSINRAKRRFFLRPAYVMRHAGDVAQARRPPSSRSSGRCCRGRSSARGVIDTQAAAAGAAARHDARYVKSAGAIRR